MKLQEFFLELEESGRCRLSLKEEFSYGTDKVDDISHSYQVAELMNSVFHLGNKAEEYVYLIAVNIQTRILGIFELSHGNMEMSTVMPREIFTSRVPLMAPFIFWLLCSQDHDHKKEKSGRKSAQNTG